MQRVGMFFKYTCFVFLLLAEGLQGIKSFFFSVPLLPNLSVQSEQFQGALISHRALTGHKTQPALLLRGASWRY